jgi:ethanolamine utilization protein EutP (predicted NTPase)
LPIVAFKSLFQPVAESCAAPAVVNKTDVCHADVSRVARTAALAGVAPAIVLSALAKTGAEPLQQFLGFAR